MFPIWQFRKSLLNAQKAIARAMNPQSVATRDFLHRSIYEKDAAADNVDAALQGVADTAMFTSASSVFEHTVSTNKLFSLDDGILVSNVRANIGVAYKAHTRCQLARMVVARAKR